MCRRPAQEDRAPERDKLGKFALDIGANPLGMMLLRRNTG